MDIRDMGYGYFLEVLPITLVRVTVAFLSCARLRLFCAHFLPFQEIGLCAIREALGMMNSSDKGTNMDLWGDFHFPLKFLSFFKVFLNSFKTK